jgi:glucose/arabinose dehydrogenase
MDRDRALYRRNLLAMVGTVGVAGCLSDDAADGGATETTEPATTATATPEDWAAPSDSPLDADVRTETIAEGLAVPWDLSFAAADELYLTERVGRLLRIAGGESEVVARPSEMVESSAVDHDEEGGWWAAGGENGLLGVAVHPAYPDPPHVFAQYTSPTDDGQRNRVVRYDVGAADPSATERAVVDGIPSGSYHAGGRLAFGPDDRLWVTCGDAGEPEAAQRTDSLAGKVLRITPEGDPAPGNPDLDGDADPRVYSYGHRNPQGLAWLPDGTPLVAEHGPGGHDVVNRLVPGGNYGWPDARTEEEYASGDAVRRSLVNTTDETWAPSGCAFYTGDAVPAWRNRLLIGALRGQHLNVVTLTRPGGAMPPAGGDAARRFDADWLDDALTATSHRAFDDELGRIRTVVQGPDGAAYAITSNRDGRPEEPFPRRNDDVLVRVRSA